MSKIYEALLRAELERAASNGNGTTPVSSEAAAARAILASLGEQLAPAPDLPAVEVLSRNPDPLPAQHPAQHPFAQSPTQVLRAALDVAVPGILPDLVRRCVWNPAMQQLPALMERGSEVEQFRSLRSRMHEFRDLNRLKSLMVSSGLPQEGKSFVAANLAISFARHKAGQVLLIDGDMRRSSLHMLLGAPNEPGLTEYLSGANTMLEVMQRAKPPENGARLPSGLASLTFIAAGVDAENAADLSGSPRFGELIKAATPLFDWIVVDTPPVNLVADGVNLARSCDGVLLIVREGVTKYEVAQRALAELKASKVLGLVLNAVKKPPVTGGYYGYDSYDAPTSNRG